MSPHLKNSYLWENFVQQLLTHFQEKSQTSALYFHRWSYGLEKVLFL